MHDVHVLAPATLHFPLLQMLHAEDKISPELGEKNPASQLTQDVAAEAALAYFPLSQVLHEVSE